MRFSSGAVLVASLLMASSARSAGTDDKKQCVQAYDAAQKLRTQNKLRAARDQLVSCTRDVCPKLVRTDCARWIDEVQVSLPTLVFAARDQHGQDRIDVRVLVDGEPIAEQLTGEEIVVDPGMHTIRFEAKGADPLEQQVAVRAGEKSRLISVTLPTPAGLVVEPVKAAQGPPADSSRGRRLPILVPIVGGAGVLAVGLGAYLALSATAELHDLRHTCAPHCPSSATDAVNLRYGTAAGVGVLGVAAVGAAAWLFFHRPAATSRVEVGLGVSPGGAVGALTVRY